MTTTKFDFNINDYVWVKLTDKGREKLRTNFEFMFAGMPSSPKYIRRQEDDDGWSRWQMHDLIQQLGDAVGMGRSLMFEPGIQVEIEQPEPAT